jgi:hypothetical protein
VGTDFYSKSHDAAPCSGASDLATRGQELFYLAGMSNYHSAETETELHLPHDHGEEQLPQYYGNPLVKQLLQHYGENAPADGPITPDEQLPLYDEHVPRV